jgi:hypothetical protein
MKRKTISLTLSDAASFLMLFGRIWWRGGAWEKAVRALLAGVCVRVTTLWRSRVVRLEREEEPDGEDMTALIKFARPVFDAMARFEFHPHIQAVLEEAAQEAHRLLSLYLLEENTCG